MSNELKTDHKFDPNLNRHYLIGRQSVLHCHHYSTLYTQVAFLAHDMDGVKNLKESGEEVFGDLLKEYFQKNAVGSADERLRIAELYWKAVGMGLIEISSSDESGGAAQMSYSHLDEGWLKKWGAPAEPVNLFTRGFLAGAFSAIYGKPNGTYRVEETKSLAKGDDVTEFRISLR